MKAKDVVVGAVCAVKVSGKIVPVRLQTSSLNYNDRRYWLGINLLTRRQVRINSAQRIRHEVPPLRARVTSPSGEYHGVVTGYTSGIVDVFCSVDWGDYTTNMPANLLTVEDRPLENGAIQIGGRR